MSVKDYQNKPTDYSDEEHIIGVLTNGKRFVYVTEAQWRSFRADGPTKKRLNWEGEITVLRAPKQTLSIETTYKLRLLEGEPADPINTWYGDVKVRRLGGSDSNRFSFSGAAHGRYAMD